MVTKTEIPSFYPDSPQAWREWLQAHHNTAKAVWVIHYKKDTGTPSLSWSEAVDEALCFGWIDSTRKTIDQARYMQLYTPRKADSMWSKINKEKVSVLVAQGRMTPAGLDIVQKAQQNGNWNILDEVEESVVPPDLAQALEAIPGAGDRFQSLSRTDRRMILIRIVLAKRPETRAKRIGEEVARMMAR